PSSATLTFGDAKKMASECQDQKEIQAVREKQLNALTDMSKYSGAGSDAVSSKVWIFVSPSSLLTHLSGSQPDLQWTGRRLFC
ncbi:hypothetical protein F8B99_26210, partial [Escherichia coli]|nr:hypothetical protein [Escherichia coli]